MCQALREWMKDEIQEKKKKAIDMSLIAVIKNFMLKKAIKRMDLPEYTTSINSLYFIDASSDTKRTLDELLRYCFDDYDCEAIIIKTAELGHNIGTDLINSKAKLRTFTAHSQAIIAESIYRKLTDDYGTKWTAAAFAEKYGVSESSIKNYFRNVYGYGFKEYQIKVRMKKAAEMLMNTDLSIKEIAAKVGYLSRAKFGEAFKNYYGISAPDYRNNAKAEKIASELAGAPDSARTVLFRDVDLRSGENTIEVCSGGRSDVAVWTFN